MYHARVSARYTLRAPPVAKITPTAIAGYIDDVHLYVLRIVNQSPIQLISALRTDFITVLHILTGLGLSVDFVKCELTLHGHHESQHSPLLDPDGDV